MNGSTLDLELVESRPSWPAIFTGVLVGLATQFLLSLLGIAIGLTTLDVSGQDQNARGVGIGAGVWTLVSAVIAWFVGAYAAGFGAGLRRRGTGLLQGISAWMLGLMVVVLLVSSGVGGMLAGAMRIAGSSANVVGQSQLLNRSDVQQFGNQAQEQLKEKTQNLGSQDAQKVTKGAAWGAWGTFITALLSFGAACLGGVAGTRAFEKGEPGRRRVFGERTVRVTPPGGPTVPTPA